MPPIMHLPCSQCDYSHQPGPLGCACLVDVEIVVIRPSIVLLEQLRGKWGSGPGGAVDEPARRHSPWPHSTGSACPPPSPTHKPTSSVDFRSCGWPQALLYRSSSEGMSALEYWKSFPPGPNTTRATSQSQSTLSSMARRISADLRLENATCKCRQVGPDVPVCARELALLKPGPGFPPDAELTCRVCSSSILAHATFFLPMAPNSGVAPGRGDGRPTFAEGAAAQTRRSSRPPPAGLGLSSAFFRLSRVPSLPQAAKRTPVLHTARCGHSAGPAKLVTAATN